MARKPTKALEDQGYSKLDSYCIGLNEFYKSLRKSGFGESIALYLITEPGAYPAWLLPNQVPPEKFGDYEDDD